jgi:hypothetical protein
MCVDGEVSSVKEAWEKKLLETVISGLGSRPLGIRGGRGI